MMELILKIKEIVINMANISTWAFNDVVRIQASGTGDTNISKVIRAINPVCGKRLDKFTGRSVVKA